MAWISVHTSTDGPKLRELRKKLKCSKAEAIGFLVYLWWWGLENAEKDGKILHADKEDIEECLGSAVVGSKLSAPQIVNAFIETGWIDSTEKGFYIHDWESWQQQWYKAKETREKDLARKRENRKKGSVEFEAANAPSKEGNESTGENAGEVNEENSKYSEGFESFWKAYPRKIDKGGAYKKYQARRNSGFTDEELILAATNYAAQCNRNKTEQQYIKHAKTFLGDTTPFVDFLPKMTEESSCEGEDSNPFDKWKGE